MAPAAGRNSQQQQDSGTTGIRVIARAADVLTALSKHPDGLSLGEIALQVGLPRSTVQRIVQALDEANLVIAASPTSGVRLGPALLVLAASVKQFSIAEISRPLVVQLSKDTGETVDVAILGSHKAVVVDQIHGTHGGGKLDSAAQLGQRKGTSGGAASGTAGSSQKPANPDSLHPQLHQRLGGIRPRTRSGSRLRRGL